MNLDYYITDEVIVKEFLRGKGFSRDIMPIIKNNLFFNDSPIRLWNKISNGKLEIKLLDEESNIKLCDIDFDVVYEDEYLIIVRKKGQLCVMPNHNHIDNNLSGMVMNYFTKNNIKSTVHLVNRLDYDTFGLVLIAKNGLIHNLIKDIEKKYYLVCKGIVKESGCINLPIKKIDGIKRAIREDGKEAITLYNLLKTNNNSLVEAKLITGRTHQIRVHFMAIGHPLIGDKLYGDDNINKLALQCHYLKFIHPIFEKEIIIDDKVDDYLLTLL